MPVQLHGLGEGLGLADAVLAGGGVEHQQHFVRGVGNELADHAVDLGQLLHQVRLVVQPAGRVDDADVGLLLDRRGHGAMGHAGRVALGRPGDDLHAQPVGPDRELLDGRGAERVGRAQHDALALRCEHVRQLGDRRGLAGAVDAGHHDHGRPAGGEADRLGRLRHQLA